jgi:hypothetical protein
MNVSEKTVEKRIRSLEDHLAQEHPILLNAVKDFRKLDTIAYRMGLLEREESFATQISWWPLIAVLGTFSAGKSTFINDYLKMDLEKTGNQAVDDKFTVIVFSPDEEIRTLPGSALNADPRFPFYRFSREIDEVAPGEGDRIDAYLQLKTCPSPRLNGKILIDSPGFDADSQRTSTLRITNHVMNLSDLVLVFFDARHPEPGAMQDTLKHLVEDTIQRHDSEKFLYILNQLDTAAREDNPEEVVASWQRAIGEKGLTAGRFFTISSPKAAVPIEDAQLRQRFESKRDPDLRSIWDRIDQVQVERAYRIIARLNKTARDIEDLVVPEITKALGKWKKRVLWADGILLAILLAALGTSVIQAEWWGTPGQPDHWLGKLGERPILAYLAAGLGVVTLLVVHFLVCKLAARSVIRGMRNVSDSEIWRVSLVHGFEKNTGPLHSIFSIFSIFHTRATGWGRGVRRRLREVVANTDDYVQTLNDDFQLTSPSASGPQRPTVRGRGSDTSNTPPSTEPEEKEKISTN